MATHNYHFEAWLHSEDGLLKYLPAGITDYRQLPAREPLLITIDGDQTTVRLDCRLELLLLSVIDGVTYADEESDDEILDNLVHLHTRIGACDFCFFVLSILEGEAEAGAEFLLSHGITACPIHHHAPNTCCDFSMVLDQILLEYSPIKPPKKLEIVLHPN